MIQNYSHVDIEKIAGTGLAEYLKLKDKHSDGVLLFHSGVFYDTFFEDARIVSNITEYSLNIKTMKAIGDFHQTGVPKEGLLTSVKKLLCEGFKVYLYNQVIDDSGKGTKERYLSRIFTPGTVFEKELLKSSENNYIMALYFKDDLFYLAYADVSTGQFYKTSGILKNIRFEIQKIAPKEVLISAKQEDIFKDILCDYYVEKLDESEFENFSIDDVILNYCHYTQLEFFTELDNPVEYRLDTFLMLDNVTRRSLELTRTKKYLKKKGSLLWFLNYTKTSMGIRHLKKILDEPLLDVKLIKQRQNAISELVETPDMLDEFTASLENFCDLSRICAKLSNSTIQSKELLLIAYCAGNLKKLKKLSKTAKARLLSVNEDKIKTVLKLADEIENAVIKTTDEEDKELEAVMGRKLILRNGYDGNLDFLRTRLKEHLNALRIYESKLRRKFKVSELLIDQSDIISYFIEVPNTKVKFIDNPEFVKKHSTTKYTRFGTKELDEYALNIQSVAYKARQLEDDLFNKLREHAGQFIETIRELAKDVAKVDVLTSLARCAVENQLTKPTFAEKGLKMEGAFHPSLIKLNNEIVKNDSILQDDSMIILTGANMSGKSTFLKYNAIIPILGQIGSFVPAQKSCLTIVDRIFLRQGSTDDIINNNSSFMVEMNDLSFILEHATNRSLILLDEPAKSTSTNEGGAIVKAFCEYILNHYKTKSIIVTHNVDITTLEEKYPSRIINYTIGTNEEGQINDRKIRRGIAHTSSAINTAILADLPDEIIELAKKYLSN